jgi:hypothetical protein
MSDWNDFISNDATPHDRLLLLLTRPQMLDAAAEHIHDILVGYWHAKEMAFVAASTPSTTGIGQGKKVRVFKWAELPDHSDVILRSQVHLSAARR